MILFPSGVQGLSDTKWQGAQGQVHRMVGVDYQSKPGIIKVQQKLTKDSGDVITELCKVNVPVSDGSTLWFSSESGKIWREVDGVYTLIQTTAIPAEDLSTATKTPNTKNVSSQVTNPTGAVMKPDGLAFYMMSNNDIYQYTLTEAFDISTAAYATKTFDVAAQCSNAKGIFIRADGIKLYVVDADDIYRYTMSTPWDISTCTYDTHTTSLAAQDSDLIGISFKSDGLTMFVSGNTNDKIYSYTLGVAWDVTSKVYVDDFSIVTETPFHYGMFINTAGTKLFILDNASGEKVFQYSLSSAWDLTTIQNDNVSYSPIGLTGIGQGMMFASDGLNFYLTSSSTPETVYQFALAPEDLNVTTLSAEEFSVPALDAEEGDEPTPYIYYTTKNYLLRVPVADLATWSASFEYLTEFAYGDDTYHPMKKQNNRLFIGDRTVLVEVQESGLIVLETDFNVLAPERITSLGIIDTDLLVGTKEPRKAWVKRWDTEALSWYAQDSVEETEIYAFVSDDNEVYVIAGDFGKIYYYDGEKMHPDVRVPGEYSKTARIKVNHNAVASFFGIPVFGVSNLEGNPAWQGIYSYGRFSKDYNVTLNFPFPLSCNTFEDIEIGSILVQGYDLMVSWKSGLDVGVDRIDWSTKYESAFIESMILLGTKDRSKFKSIDEILADYHKFPAYDADTNPVEFSVENNYQGFNDIEPQTVVDAKLYQIRAKSTQKELGAVAVMIEFNTVENEGPEIENFHVNFAGEK